MAHFASSLALILSTLDAGASLPPAPAPSAKEAQMQQVAQEFIERLSRGDAAGAEEHFDQVMKSALPPEKLSALWAQLTTRRGAFQRIVSQRLEPMADGGFTAIELVHFATESQALLVALAPNGTIRGLFTDAAGVVGRRFVERLSQGDFVGATQAFDETLTTAAPPAKLTAFWQKLQDRLGAFQSIQKVTTSPIAEAVASWVEIRFARGTETLKIVVNPRAQIIGYFIESPDLTGAWKPPSYADSSAFAERAVEVGTSPPLPGHLTVPNGKGPFPLAILVHGSGPSDEDETVAGNKPFKDLAYGLPSRGVAVLRYDKRTHLKPPPNPATIRAEYFQGVTDALALAHATPGIDPRRIVLIGHSLGAMLAPWLAKENPGVAGIALLAAPARSGLEPAVEQFEQLARQHPDSAAVAQALEQVRHDRDRLASPDLRADEPIFHVTGAYWMTLRDYAPVKTAAALKLPIWVGQGGRDYNVSPTVDYRQWQDGLAGSADVTFKLYPTLNHLFISWWGKASVEDNAHPGNVDKKVVEDLSSWILALSPRAPPH